jgi:amino acid permease
MMFTEESQKRWGSSLTGGLVFAALSSHTAYKLTGKVASPGTLSTSNGCPTMAGLFLHTVVFTLIVRYLMSLGNCGLDELETQEESDRKNWYSLYSGLLFALLSSPFMHSIANKLVKGKSDGEDPSRCSGASLAITTALYILIIRFSMEYRVSLGIAEKYMGPKHYLGYEY